MECRFARAMTAALLCVCAGCNGCTSGGSAPVDDSPVIVHEGEAGRIEANLGGGQVVLPADFPSDVPQYQGAQLLLVSNSPKGITLSFRAGDPADKVAQFYMASLGEKGWEAPRDRAIGGAHVISAAKQGRRLVVSIAQQAGASLVTVSVVSAN